MIYWMSILLIVVYLFYVIRKVIQIIVSNGDPAKTVAWVLFIIFIPIIGVFFYHLIGINYRKEKKFKAKYLKDKFLTRAEEELQIILPESPEIRKSIQENSRLINLLQKNGKSTLTLGNEIEILRDGGPTFDAIFAAIKNARHYIHLEYYIFLESAVTNQLIELLADKVSQGVVVRIIYDGVGSWQLNKKYIDKIRAADIYIFPFMPVAFGLIANRINYRNHRKIVVVDGEIGFTGGINVDDKYVNGDEVLGAWKDTHLRIRGPAAKCLNNIFRQDWYFVSGEKIELDYDALLLSNQEASPVQIIASGPDSDYASIRQEYFTLINEAEEYIYITTPYFIPGIPIIEALKVAALSDVEVIILLPRNSDSKILKWSIASYLEDLLEAGVRIFLYQNGFLHSKTIVADDNVASIGTANVDQRSFDQNFEVNALIYDPKICQQLKSYFFEDLVESEELSLDLYNQRPKSQKLLESTARLLSPLL